MMLCQWLAGGLLPKDRPDDRKTLPLDVLGAYITQHMITVKKENKNLKQ